MVNYNNRVFKPVSNTENGETSNQTTFFYKQVGNVLTAEYSGGKILKEHLNGLVDENGYIDMRYDQVNNIGLLMTGKCTSKPEILENGKFDYMKIENGHQMINQKVNQLLKKFNL